MEFNGLPSEWRMMTLGNLGEVNRGRSRHRPRHAPYLYGGPYPFIQTGDIKASGGRITSHIQTYSEAGLAQSRLWPAGTMCITIAANIAETAILTYPACFPDSVIGFIANDDVCDVRFIEYTFRHLKRQLQHESRESGTVQDNINLQTIDRTRFPLPPFDEQKVIASVLGQLDDKIELNRRMNETLEATARAIFRSWFVDFDPVVAKVEGRQPYGMSSDTAALFPEHFEESELGPMPAGWTVSTVGEQYELTMGTSPPGSAYNEEGDGVPFFQGRRDFTFRYPMSRVYCTAPKRFANAGDTLVSVRAPVGDANMAAERCCVGRGVAAVRHKSGSRSYSYYAMHELGDEFAAYEGTGTVFGSIGKTEFESLKRITSPDELVAKFHQVADPIDQQIEVNEAESMTLAGIRDALLPKLLSGEIRVSQAERMIGEVVC